MRMLRAFGLVVIGFVVGAVAWSAWSGEPAQAQQAAASRFSVSGRDIGGQPSVPEGTPLNVHYIRDNKTGDYYLLVLSAGTMLTKSPNSACVGF